MATDIVIHYVMSIFRVMRYWVHAEGICAQFQDIISLQTQVMMKKKTPEPEKTK